jgi:hypothetical protein
VSREWELWGTFSVGDHLRANSFVAELLLYDRLVVPVPPQEGGAEWSGPIADELAPLPHLLGRGDPRFGQHAGSQQITQQLAVTLTFEAPSGSTTGGANHPPRDAYANLRVDTQWVVPRVVCFTRPAREGPVDASPPTPPTRG